jgi:hypothetical protein
MRLRHWSAVAAAMMVVSLVACDDKKNNLAPAASSLAPSTPPPPSSTVKKFVVEAESKTSIQMEAPKETIKATVTGASGTLDVDLADLTRSRGEVKMDLTTLETHTFTGDKATDNATQTKHARTWLEVADGEDGKLDEKVKQANRYALYAIRSVEQASASDITKVAPTKDSGDEVRQVTLTTKGELLVHGHKVMRDADLEVAFRYDPGAPADDPKAITIKSRKPLRVVLAEHDVKPRDSFGKIAKGSFHLLGTKVADNADVTLDLRAKRAP